MKLIAVTNVVETKDYITADVQVQQRVGFLWLKTQVITRSIVYEKECATFMKWKHSGQLVHDLWRPIEAECQKQLTAKVVPCIWSEQQFIDYLYTDFYVGTDSLWKGVGRYVANNLNIAAQRLCQSFINKIIDEPMETDPDETEGGLLWLKDSKNMERIEKYAQWIFDDNSITLERYKG